MAEELEYTSKYDGKTSDAIMDYSNKLRQQTSATDADTVQVFDTSGNPHKISKTELLKKSALALPSLNDISAFVAVNQAGNAIGLMTKQQVATVLGGLIGLVSAEKSGLAHQFMYGISPKYINSSTSQYTIIAKIPMTCSGYILATGGIQASYSANMAALIHVTCEQNKFYAKVVPLDGAEPELYYKVVDGYYQLSVKDKSTWWHVCSSSFHPGIAALAQKLNDISGWTKL